MHYSWGDTELEQKKRETYTLYRSAAKDFALPGLALLYHPGESWGTWFFGKQYMTLTLNKQGRKVITTGRVPPQGSALPHTPALRGKGRGCHSPGPWARGRAQRGCTAAGARLRTGMLEVGANAGEATCDPPPQASQGLCRQSQAARLIPGLFPSRRWRGEPEGPRARARHCAPSRSRDSGEVLRDQEQARSVRARDSPGKNLALARTGTLASLHERGRGPGRPLRPPVLARLVFPRKQHVLHNPAIPYLNNPFNS